MNLWTRNLCLLFLTTPLLHGASPDGFRISTFTREGEIVFTNTYSEGAVSVSRASVLPGPWVPEKNVLTTHATAATRLLLSGDAAFYRAAAVDLAPGTPNGLPGFTNLTRVYGRLTTIAGAGGYRSDGVNYWRPEFEGGPATNANLSRPHIAMADRAGNVYIADKNAHAIRMVRPDGIIVTVAGTGQPGNGPDAATPALESALNQPNGLWVQEDGTVFILDLMNNKIRRLDTNGLVSTVLSNPAPLLPGRGLWVNPEGTEIYFNSTDRVHKWTAAEGITTNATGFLQLGNLHRDPITGELVATDRTANLVYRIESDGTKVPIAGNGSSIAMGDGAPALETGFYGVRTAWFLPTGGFFLGTHQGNQMWYVDTDGYAHLFVNGAGGATHAGDGTWFYNPFELRMSELRAITADHEGNLFITESDYGYVRKIEFLPMPED